MTTDRQQILNNKIHQDISDFRDQCLTLHLATLDKDGQPNASYAPFVFHNNQYAVLISEMAKHARNLQQVEKASLMLIEDESTAKELFARKRLTHSVSSNLIDKDSRQGQILLEKLKLRYGERIDELGKLGDFHLFAFTPLDGLFVKGFGKAFRLNAQGEIQHIRGGHRNQLNTNK